MILFMFVQILVWKFSSVSRLLNSISKMNKETCCLEKKSCLPHSTIEKINFLWLYSDDYTIFNSFCSEKKALITESMEKHLHDYSHSIILLPFLENKQFVPFHLFKRCIEDLSTTSLNGKQTRLVKEKMFNSYSSNFVDVFRFYHFHKTPDAWIADEWILKSSFWR